MRCFLWGLVGILVIILLTCYWISAAPGQYVVTVQPVRTVGRIVVKVQPVRRAVRLQRCVLSRVPVVRRLRR